MFAFKPDCEEVLKRFDAWWERTIIDRPFVSIINLFFPGIHSAAQCCHVA